MIGYMLKMVYPPKCILCKRILDATGDEYLCRLCYDKFRGEKKHLIKEDSILQEVGCQTVLRKQENGESSYFEALETGVPQCIALLPYTSEYRSAILSWKYKGIRKYAKAFAKLFVEEQKVFKDVKVDALIPVPLAPTRFRKRGFNQALDLALEIRKRGFNQALDLALEIGELSHIPVWDYLERSRDTKPQAECKREERYSNIQGSIRVKKKVLKQLEETDYVIEGRTPTKDNETVNHIVLVDDIYTTGSTVRECIKVLKKIYIFKDVIFDIIVVGRGNF